MKTIPLFGSGVDSYSKSVTAQRRLNCFYDNRADSDKAAIVIRGTPGSNLWLTLPNSPIRGWYVQGNILYVAANKVLYSVTAAGVVTQLGVLNTSSGYVSFADNAVQLILADGTNGYIYTLITGSYAQSALNTAGSFGAIADGNFPAGATSVEFIDGRFLANLGGSRQCFASYAYDGTNWGATSPANIVYFTKENSSDKLINVSAFEGTIMLWGQNSIEFWQDVGGATLPYQRITGSTSIYGLGAVLSIAVVAGLTYFLAACPGGGVQVCVLNSYAPKVISTPDIDHIINSFAVTSDAIGFNYLIDGHDMYQLTFPTANRSFLFDATMGMWSEVQTGTTPYTRHYAQLGIVFDDVNYFTDATSGNIYQFSQYAYTDNGTPQLRQCTSMHIRNQGNVFGIAELYIDMDTGEGLQSGQGSSPLLMIEVSKDQGRTYGTMRTVPIGGVGQYYTRAVSRRFGMARDFVFRITLSDPIPFIITDAAVSTFAQEA